MRSSEVLVNETKVNASLLGCSLVDVAVSEVASMIFDADENGMPNFNFAFNVIRRATAAFHSSP